MVLAATQRGAELEEGLLIVIVVVSQVFEN